MPDWSDEQTDDPTHADRRNFYKVEKWRRDGLRVELILYAGNNLDKARRIFERTAKHRSRIRLTLPPYTCCKVPKHVCGRRPWSSPARHW